MVRSVLSMTLICIVLALMMIWVFVLFELSGTILDALPFGTVTVMHDMLLKWNTVILT